MQFNQYYSMEVADCDVMLLGSKHHKYIANHKARELGMEGRKKELRLRRLTTSEYCQSVGRSYENVLIFDL